MIAVTQARIHAPARDTSPAAAPGQDHQEALRAFKRHLIRTIYRLLAHCAPPEIEGAHPLHHIEVILSSAGPVGPVGAVPIGPRSRLASARGGLTQHLPVAVVADRTAVMSPAASEGPSVT